MNHKKLIALGLLGLVPLLVTACSASIANPLDKAQATAVPGLSMELHAASASDATVDIITATLYFRYLDEPLLAPETRQLTVRRDESMELAILRALLSGPSAGHSDLKRLFPDTVEVVNVASQDQILYVTLSGNLITDDEVPGDWRQQAAWRTEAPLLRQLSIQSLVASVTETHPYTGVQILVDRKGEPEKSQRLDNAYFLNDTSGLSDPQPRNEALLLTPQNTAERLLSCWHHRDYEALYNYIANADGGESKPSYQEVSLLLDEAPSLSAYSASGGTVSPDGSRCVVSLTLAIQKEGEVLPPSTYPLPLWRENGIWKISYTQLRQLMNP